MHAHAFHPRPACVRARLSHRACMRVRECVCRPHRPHPPRRLCTRREGWRPTEVPPGPFGSARPQPASRARLHPTHTHTVRHGVVKRPTIQGRWHQAVARAPMACRRCLARGPIEGPATRKVKGLSADCGAAKSRSGCREMGSLGGSRHAARGGPLRSWTVELCWHGIARERMCQVSQTQ